LKEGLYNTYRKIAVLGLNPPRTAILLSNLSFYLILKYLECQEKVSVPKALSQPLRDPFPGGFSGFSGDFSCCRG
jgi:hypothetical protein